MSNKKYNSKIMEWDITDENKLKLSINEAKFIFEQSDKILKDSSDSSQIIVARSTTLLTLIIAIITGLISYSIAVYQKNFCFSPDIFTSLIISIYSIVICFLLVFNIKPKDYHIIGRRPKDLLKNDFFGIDNRELNFYLSEIKANQDKIEFNETINIKRWDKFNKCILLIVFIPIILIPVYVITTFLLHPF
jgi:hypothetical protein